VLYAREMWVVVRGRRLAGPTRSGYEAARRMHLNNPRLRALLIDTGRGVGYHPALLYRESHSETAVAKKKKRMSKEELRAPDAFEKKAEEVWKKIEPHKGKIGALLFLLIAAGIGWTVYSKMTAGAAEEKAGSLASAMHPMTAAIWDPEVDGKERPDGTTPTKPSGETFKTEDDARKAALERMSTYLSENANAEGANAIALGVAGLKVKDDPKAAAADLDAWIGKNGDNKAAPLVRLVAARAHAAAGDKEAARGHFDAVAKNTDSWLKAAALTGLGDLDNPLMAKKGAKSDAAAAKKNYEEAVKFVGDGENIAAAGLKRELDTKIAALP